MNKLFDGTTSEFEKIVNSNKLIVYSVVYSIVSNNSDTDDIVQDTFIYAYYNYQTLKCKEKLTAWLCAIAKNKSYDSVKKSRHIVSIDNFSDAESKTTPENAFLRKEKSNLIICGIDNLSEKLRDVVLMFYFANRSIKEISRILSIPEGTVKFRLNEGRKKLKKELFDIMTEERSNIEKKEIFENIKKETEKAWDAMHQKDTKLASDICDSVLKDEVDLSILSIDELKTLDSLYNAKIHAIQFAEGFNATDKYYLKAIEIAEALKDTAWISSAYSSYAANLSNTGRLEDSSKYYSMALSKAKENGAVSLISNCMYWCAIDAFKRKTEDRGLAMFKEILDMKDRLFANEPFLFSNAQTYTLAYSSTRALEADGKHNIQELDDFVSTCPVIGKKDNGIGLNCEQGYTDGEQYCEDIFYLITRLEPCLSNDIKEGYVYEQNTFSCSHMPIRSRYEVIGMNETVHVLGGEFDNCLHTRYINFVSDDDRKLNKVLNGVTDIWYAPNVGVIRIVFTPIEGNNISHELKEYKVASEANATIQELYLPLTVGNKWSYETFDFNNIPKSDEKDYSNTFEVICKIEDNTLISHAGWGYPKQK